MSAKKRSIASIVLLLTVGGIFSALGVAVFVITVDGVIRFGFAYIGAGIVMPLLFILALLGFGITALVMGGKQIYFWIREVKTHKSGKDGTARIVDYKKASFSKSSNTRIRYALVLPMTTARNLRPIIYTT